MDNTRTFTGTTETEIWHQVAADMAQQEDWFEYEAVLLQDNYQVQLNIDIDLGGGFESGSETTIMIARVPNAGPFQFALHEQDWLNELGKLVGMTDVELGDPEIDEAFIIKTNNPPLLHTLLADPALRQTLLHNRGMRLTLGPATYGPEDEITLEFSLDKAITQPAQLQKIYHLLLTILRQIAPPPAPAASVVGASQVA